MSSAMFDSYVAKRVSWLYNTFNINLILIPDEQLLLKNVEFCVICVIL